MKNGGVEGDVILTMMGYSLGKQLRVVFSRKVIKVIRGRGDAANDGTPFVGFLQSDQGSVCG